MRDIIIMCGGLQSKRLHCSRNIGIHKINIRNNMGINIGDNIGIDIGNKIGIDIGNNIGISIRNNIRSNLGNL